MAERYVMAGPNTGPDKPVWCIIDKHKPQPGSKIIEWVEGRDKTQRRVDELNATTQTERVV